MMNAVPRSYLGAQIHPSENPLLPAHEQIRDSQPVDGYDASNDVALLKKATKGFGVSVRAVLSSRSELIFRGPSQTDEGKIHTVLMNMPAVRLPVLKHTYKAREGKDLETLMKKELKGDHETLIVQVLGGPLGGDIDAIEEACKGLGTKEVHTPTAVVPSPPALTPLSLLTDHPHRDPHRTPTSRLRSSQGSLPAEIQQISGKDCA